MTKDHKKRAIWIALITVAIALAIQFLTFAKDGRELKVSDAHVTGRAVDLVAPQTGLVSASLLRPYTWVHEGDLALVLNQAEYEASLEHARQRLESTLLARVNACLLMAVQDSEKKSAEAALRGAQADFARAVELNNMNFISRQALEERSLSLAEKAQTRETRSIETSRLRSDALRPLLLSEDISQAVADLRQVLASKSRHFIHVPRDGFVYGAVARTGDTVAEGAVLARFVPKGPIEVEALVLETQVATLQRGTEAVVRFDAIAIPPQRGVVIAITPAIAAMFTPAVRPNMDSNWIKVNQRIPVVVAVDPWDADHPIAPLGSSSEVTFFPGRKRAIPAAPSAPVPTPGNNDLDTELMDSIDTIVQRTRDLAITATEGVSQCNQSIVRLWSSWKQK